MSDPVNHSRVAEEVFGDYVYAIQMSGRIDPEINKVAFKVLHVLSTMSLQAQKNHWNENKSSIAEQIYNQFIDLWGLSRADFVLFLQKLARAFLKISQKSKYLDSTLNHNFLSASGLADMCKASVLCDSKAEEMDGIDMKDAAPLEKFVYAMLAAIPYTDSRDPKRWGCQRWVLGVSREDALAERYLPMTHKKLAERLLVMFFDQFPDLRG